MDAYWPDCRLIVECDSYFHHGTRSAFEADRERDAELQTRGYRVLRFTHRQVTRRAAWVARTVVAARA